MRRVKDHLLVGRWRSVTADLWDANRLDLSGPAMIIIKADGTGDEVDQNARCRSSSTAC